MKTYKLWKDFETDMMKDHDLFRFALDLWKDGSIKVTSHWDKELCRSITRYSINVWEDEKNSQ